MSLERREQLERKAGRRLSVAFRKVIKMSNPKAIDIEMFWPPDHDAINFLVQADRRDIDWNFTIPTAHWQISSDPEDTFPSHLLTDIRSFFRSTWKKVCEQGNSEARAYLRLHENDAAIDLRNGRQVNDRDRTDYVAPNRIPFKKTKGSTKRKRRDGEVIRRGTSLAKVKREYGVTDDPDPKVQGKSQYYWPDRGMRIGFKNGKVVSVIYFAPFPDLVGGIWVGAHAWEVDALLGTAKDEGHFCTGRVWQYDVKGFMAVGFDKQDRVRSIARWTR
ncbi:hypothetical protein SH528x_003178 [Novipirellula sp. SH528]|uniref:hypothetical protein n=1 Tax=Novipirellula sp. SH528 TaxID=3454466 RepID=UPI003FA14579